VVVAEGFRGGYQPSDETRYEITEKLRKASPFQGEGKVYARKRILDKT
jgi:hypothetical protein